MNKALQRRPCGRQLLTSGDKWSLLVVRDLLHGKHTYGTPALSPERIPTHHSCGSPRASGAGIVTRTPYQQRPVVSYTLTPKGHAWASVVLRLCVGAKQHIPGTGHKPGSSEARLRGVGDESLPQARAKRACRAAGGPARCRGDAAARPDRRMPSWAAAP
jgi:DNA-binding HxlR family transcriptional regulator